MRIKNLLVALSIIFGVSTAFGYETVETLTLPVNGINSINIECGAGYLKVSGNENLSEIRVRAEISIPYASQSRAREIIENELDLSLETRGGRAVLRSEHHRVAGGLFRRDYSVVVNLTVVVPENLQMRINDGSGEIDIRNLMGNLSINDGSGETNINDIRGDVSIDDGSGELAVSEVTGNLDIDDGSGEIMVRRVQGNVNVDDGSGNMDIADVGGSITIRDGSGNITVRDVDQDVQVRESGSGGVWIENVAGAVSGGDVRIRPRMTVY